MYGFSEVLFLIDEDRGWGTKNEMNVLDAILPIKLDHVVPKQPVETTAAQATKVENLVKDQVEPHDEDCDSDGYDSDSAFEENAIVVKVWCRSCYDKLQAAKK